MYIYQVYRYKCIGKPAVCTDLRFHDIYYFMISEIWRIDKKLL